MNFKMRRKDEATRMMSLSIRAQIIVLVGSIAITLGIMAGIVAPYQAKNLGAKLQINDTRFIAKLLAESLALDMQTSFLDDGEGLEQTLQLLKNDDQNSKATISDIWIYDENLNFVKGLNGGPKSDLNLEDVDQFVLENLEESIKVWMPIRDSDMNLQGFVDIHFSKHMLNELVSSNTNSSLVLAALAAIVIIIVGFLLGNRIGQPISAVVGLTNQMNEEFKKFVNVVDAIAENDLTLQIQQSEIKNIRINSNNEIGMLANAIEGTIEAKNSIGSALNKMVSNLNDIINQLNSNAAQLVLTASEIASSSDKMTHEAKEQASQVSQVSSAIEEMAVNIKQTSINSDKANDISQGASEIASNGGKVVNETIQGMKQINDVVDESAKSISKLAKSAEQIGEIVSVINDIADQTNLLALNAAIEAARAGEQGRGFAVVADEVRKLAERTGTATDEITSMINGIQNQTNDAVKSMDTGVKEVEKGRRLADKAGSSLTEVVNMSQNVMDMIRQIAAAADQQSSATQEVSSNVEIISSVTKETSSYAEKSAVVAEELNRQAEKMQQVVSKFKIRD